VATRILAGAGTQSAGLGFGGATSGGATATTNEYNGTAWSAGGAYPVATYALAGAGTQSAGLGFGGYSSGALTYEYGTPITPTLKQFTLA